MPRQACPGRSGCRLPARGFREGPDENEQGTPDCRNAVEAAGAPGFTQLRLFVAAGQARARRFYEREGWLPVSEPFDDPSPGLTMIEYRHRLRDDE